LPPSFTIALKELIAWTLAPPAEEEDEDGNLIDIPSQIKDGTIWSHFDTLGLIDRYETLIASVCYEYIEAHVLEECTGQWAEPMLASLRSWMGNTVVPWMVMPYARGAKTGARIIILSTSIVQFAKLEIADEARNMLQGIGSRFDFHVCKTLCDLRLVLNVYHKVLH
jgi:anaphase-promoting complex subunit 2